MSEPNWEQRCAELKQQLAAQQALNQSLTRRVTQLEERLAASAAVAESASMLEAEVLERDERLDQAMVELRSSNQALLSAKIAAEAASTTKSQFLANMSHEIRTPLTSIIGFSETLFDPELSSEERTCAIESIIRAGRHLLGLINDILDLSKIEADKLDVEHVSIDLLQMLREVEALAGMQAKAKALSFQVDVAYPIPEYIKSDPLRLKQILINLAGNAIKFTQRGGVRLQLCYLAEQQQVQIEVIDSGIGLSEAQQANLFQAFNQADVTTTREYGGTGLGLYLSKKLATTLGGNITVYSTPGAGSNFSLTVATGDLTGVSLLPSAPVIERDVPADIIHDAPTFRCEGRVLLVDDNRDNQKLISMYLRRLGAQVSVAENGLQAVEQAMQSKFDLILMDMQMPVMCGREATQILREKGNPTVILALTANSQKSDIEQCLLAGCDDFLSKPIDRVKFEEIMRVYMPAVTKSISNDEAVHSLLLAENDPELEELLTGFIQRLPDYFQKITTAYNSADWPALKAVLHTMKGICGNYGYPDLGLLAAQAEHCLRDGENSDIHQHIERFHAYQRRIQAGYLMDAVTQKNTG